MDNSEKTTALSPQAIADFFKRSFVSCDNLPRNIALENQIIDKDKASFLILTYLKSGRFAPFMKAGIKKQEGSFASFMKTGIKKQEGRWIFSLKNPIVQEVTRNGAKYQFLFKDFEIQTGENPVSADVIWPSGNMKEAKSLYNEIWYGLNFNLPYNLCVSAYIDCNRNSSKENSCSFSNGRSIEVSEGAQVDLVELFMKANDIFRSHSLFDICKDISPYNTPEKVCRYFGVDWHPYGEGKESYNGTRLDSFHIDSSIILDGIKGDPKFADSELVEAFKFDNAYGEAVQDVILAKRKDNDGEQKLLYPLTCWMQDYQAANAFNCVPLPKVQILYNLDKLVGAKAMGAPKTIVLTDSVQIAAANEKRAGLDVIFTSWICDETAADPFKQVEWSPLKNIGPIYYLLTNHSGMSMADAYIKAYNLADFLQDNYDINLRFIQAPVKFSRKGEPQGLESENFELIEVFDEFEKMYKKACEALTASVPPWYSKAIASAPQTVVSESVLDRLSKKHEALPYLLRPFITRGEVSLLHATTGLGKSALAYSLSASVISGEMPFQEHLESGVAVGERKWWTVPPLKDGFRKVLYLDFELGQQMIGTYTKDYFLPYLPDDKEAREACLANFDVRDLRTDTTDYSQEENQSKILKMIEDSAKKGSGRKVDMVVFDTYTRMVGGNEDIETWARINPLMGKLREMEVAVLIVHHSNKDGKSRGFMNKEDAFAAIAGMRREGDKPGTLEMPIEFKATKLRAACVRRDYDSFEIRFIGEKWTVHKAETPAKAEFSEIVESYKSANYGRDAIAWMMGMGHDKCNRLTREYKSLTSNKKG